MFGGDVHLRTLVCVADRERERETRPGFSSASSLHRCMYSSSGSPSLPPYLFPSLSPTHALSTSLAVLHDPCVYVCMCVCVCVCNTPAVFMSVADSPPPSKVSGGEYSVFLRPYSQAMVATGGKTAAAGLTELTGAKKRLFNALRIVLIVVLTLCVAFNAVTFVLSTVLGSNPYKYTGHEKQFNDAKEAGHDTSREGNALGEFLFSFLFILSASFSGFNVVTFVVCLGVAIASPHRLLLGKRPPIVCLLITTMFGFIFCVYTTALYTLDLSKELRPPAAVAILASVSVLAYFIMQTVTACVFTCVDDMHLY